jgi:16S rRNA (adenine1518-N6/adenine1519-N6)-dimethyltransferase
MMNVTDGLLGPAEIRELTSRLGIRPTKTLGQNFLYDANTVRKIVRIAHLKADEVVVEVGPGLGSLTLGLLPACAKVVAVEVDPVLAQALPATVFTRAPRLRDRLEVIMSDALRITELPEEPSALVANLPYNVAVPIVLHFLATFSTIRHGLVMVQSEVADRLVAQPGNKIYGVPSVKLAWYAQSARVSAIPRTVFWPVPNVDSALVSFTRHDPPTFGAQIPNRVEVFRIIDAAFAQRRKTLRTALAGIFSSAARAEQILREAGIDPQSRGEQLTVTDFARIATVSLNTW